MKVASNSTLNMPKIRLQLRKPGIILKMAGIWPSLPRTDTLQSSGAILEHSPAAHTTFEKQPRSESKEEFVTVIG